MDPEPGFFLQGTNDAVGGARLTDRQIRTIIEFIKSTWPERARAVQAERSEADS